MKSKGYSITAIGRREQNQDNFLVDNDRGLYAVADGIGGGLKGDVASLMAVTGLGAHPGEPSRLRDTFETLQAGVLKEAMDTIGEPLMGTTLTALSIQGANAELCHAGDSRCYIFKGGRLRQLTEDHETYDDSLGGPVLSSYLGIPTDTHPFRVQEDWLQLHPGDKFILCSDGLYKQVTENYISAKIQALHATPDKLLQDLVSEAEKKEHSDNITIVYIEIE